MREDMNEENRGIDNGSNINWSRFKSEGNRNVQRAKNAYIEFCRMLDEVDFELIDDYVGNKDKVELVYKLDDSIKLNIRPISFKTYTYKSIINFKNDLEKNNDKFIRFVGLTNGNSLIAKIKTFDDGVVDICITNYSSFNKGRQDFYDKLKEINGCTTDFYKGSDSKININIDGTELNLMIPDIFKAYTYKAIINFKNKLKENGDRFVKFIGLTDGGNLIARIRTFDGGEVEIDINAYSKFTKARQDFYSKLKEVNGYTDDCYKGADIKMNIYIDDVKLNPISPRNFKRQTYRAIINFKNNLEENNDKFIKFIGLTSSGNLISQIRTYDDGVIDMDMSRYISFNKSRKNTYDYCKEKGYKILSSYLEAMEKILINFNCGHKPHWITPAMLKQSQSCPICSESKGERAVRLYLEKNNIEFKQEYRFDDCRYKDFLRFDFYIPSLNLCIEFDGEQHYKANDYFGKKEFELTQKRDRIKNNYCEEKGIGLLRIPYWEIDNVDKILNKELKKLRKMNSELKEVC